MTEIYKIKSLKIPEHKVLIEFKDKDEFLKWNYGDNLLCIHNKYDEYIYYAVDDVVIGYYKTKKRIE